MALKSFLTNLEGISDALKSEYTATDGGYTLNVDNADFNSRLAEFRNNNITYRQDKEKLESELAKFKGVEPAKYAEMSRKLQELEDKKLLDSGQIDELVAQKAAKFKSEYEDQINVLTENIEKANQQAATYKGSLDGLAVNDLISKAISDIGKLNKGALPDVLARAANVWKVNENGVPVALDGDKKLYGKDGKDYLTATEWAENLRQQAPYFFEGNTGGAAPGSPSAGNDGTGKRQIPASEAMNHIEAIQKGEAVIIQG